MPNPLEHIMKLEADIEKILRDHGCVYIEESFSIDASGYIFFAYYFPLDKRKELPQAEVDAIVFELESLNPDLTLKASQIWMDHHQED